MAVPRGAQGGPSPKRHTFPCTMMQLELVHEKLDGYPMAVNFAAWACTVCRTLIKRGKQVREGGSRDGDEYEYE